MMMKSKSLCDRLEDALELVLAADRRNKLDLRAGELNRRRNNEHVLDLDRLDDLRDRRVAQERVVDAQLALVLVQPEPRGRVALGIKIDQEYLLLPASPREAARFTAVVLLPTPPF